MSDFGDWHDPFADDEAARERERRRAEREARRREQRRALADKVRAEREPEPPRTAKTAPATPAAEPAAPSPSRVTAAREALQGRLTRRPGAERGRPPPNVVARRRLLGGTLLAGLLALIAFGAVTVADRIGGGDPVQPAAAKVSSVTIPEGLDRRQIAETAKDAGLSGDYVKASRSAKGFPLDKYGAKNADSLEGFLFPATYELERKASAKDLVARQLDAFRDNIAKVDMKYAESKNLNEYDVLKIASMVEREVQVPEERRQVAAVIYNRLAAGNPLGIDATIRYEDGNYDEQLTESRLAEDTPYNTRINPGLPPTPIGNPGLASIKAAANPARNDNFYFVIKPGTCGEHVFVETEEEFAEAEAAYQAALEEQGGSPTEC